MITILLISFLILVLLGIPIAFALGISSIFALVYVGDYSLMVVVQRMFTAVDSFSLMAIPFFMFSGGLMESGGISKRIVNFANALVGFITGGLAMVGVVSSMIFAGISGSAVLYCCNGSILIPSMEEKNTIKDFQQQYWLPLELRAIIPPSIPLVVYGPLLEFP